LALFKVCDKVPTFHPTHDSPRGLDPANFEATDPVQQNLDSWHTTTLGRCALCMLVRRLVPGSGTKS